MFKYKDLIKFSNIERPDSVNLAIKASAMAMTLIPIHLLMSLWSNREILSYELVGFVAFVNILNILILVFLLKKISYRKNWARMLFIGLLILNATSEMKNISQSLVSDPITGYLGLASLLLLVFAATLLHSRTAANWFNA